MRWWGVKVLVQVNFVVEICDCFHPEDTANFSFHTSIVLKSGLKRGKFCCDLILLRKFVSLLSLFHSHLSSPLFTAFSPLSLFTSTRHDNFFIPARRASTCNQRSPVSPTSSPACFQNTFRKILSKHTFLIINRLQD